MEIVDVNYWAVLLAGVMYFLLGGLWYSPLLFAKPWMAAMDIEESEIGKLQEGAAQAYLVSFMAALVSAFVTALFVKLLGTSSLQGALTTGFFIWLGFIVTTNAPPYFYEDRPKRLYTIYSGYTLTGFLVMAAILTFWK